MNDRDNLGGQDEGAELSRRRFLKATGNVAVGTVVGGALSGVFWLDNAVAAVPASEGYLLVDTKKCQGCVSCMLSCSLINEGVENLSLSRIQIIQNSFEKWPDDVMIEQCRQCVEPKCLEACPVDAIEANPEHGNVRQVNLEKCIGCGLCAEACPFTPSRPLMAPDDTFEGSRKSRKCDLCANAPYHWDDAGGGPEGTQACVEVCPVGAIKFTAEVPAQEGDAGYNVNLRDAAWGKLGFPTD
ncbi:MAG: 4Fe-4S dicluster domain-containing protein [Planctomycetota bacterium]|jgi:protein NrfC|nr:4Fe-4S dicluster domain-containing protein [Planctomycetota bacterium]